MSELIVPPEQRDDHERAVRDYLETGDSVMAEQVMEISALHRDGSELPVEISIAGLKTSEGWSLNAFLHDISDRRKADRVTDEFLALVSHELRTPLSSIVAHIELLLDEGEELTDTVRRQFLDVINRSSSRLQRLVGDLLFVAQLQSTELSLRLEPVDLAEVAAQAVQAAQPAQRAWGSSSCSTPRPPRACAATMTGSGRRWTT